MSRPTAPRSAHPSLDITHIGHPEAAALEEALRAEFPDAQREIAWLLGAGSAGEATYGRPLNHALLRFAGRAFLSVDDDVTLDARRPALTQPGFAVTDEADELLWYENEASLWRECPAVELDPLAAHASWIGMPLAAAWKRARNGSRARSPRSALQPRTRNASHRESRVLFTHNHACGDPGSSVLPLQLLTLPPQSRQWLAAHPQAAAFAFDERINWRGQTSLRLAPRRVLTFTTMSGIDNSVLMPPAARAHRSEDVLLGVIAQFMHPHAWFVDLPFGLPHLRSPAKHWLPPTASFGQEPLHVIYALIDEQASRVVAESAPEPARRRGGAVARCRGDERCDADGAAACNMRAMPPAARCSRSPSNSRRRTSRRSGRHCSPPGSNRRRFAVDADRLRRRVLAASEMRSLADAYGHAMQVWPQLWASCRERFR